MSECFTWSDVVDVPLGDDELAQLVAPIVNRRPGADQALLRALLLLLDQPEGLDSDGQERLTRAVLGAKYWLNEPGSDHVNYWSEAPQITFAVCEYLAGQLFADRMFTTTHTTGADRMRRAELRITQWCEDRFMAGFVQWCSESYEQCAQALALLHAHARDVNVAARAAMLLDLLFLDLALHSFDGQPGGSRGAITTIDSLAPLQGLMSCIREAKPKDLSWHHPSLVLAMCPYRVPQTITEIALQEQPAVVRQCSGMDVAERIRLRDGLENKIASAWGADALSHPAAAAASAEAIRTWRLGRNSNFRAIKQLGLLDRAHMLGDAGRTLVVSALNPVSQGTAFQKANLYTFRTPDYQLSSVTHHCVGKFGHRQYVWQAALPRAITVFAVHPQLNVVEGEPLSAQGWLGNAILPDVGQSENVLLACYDIRGRRGLRERKRAEFTNLYFPFVEFDETRLGSTWVTGRVGSSYIGIRSLDLLEMVGPTELRQRGKITGYGAICGGSLDFAHLRDFTAVVKETELTWQRGKLTFATPQGTFEIRDGKGLWRDGRRIALPQARFDTPWVRADRPSKRLDVCGTDHRLVLDWAHAERTETSA